MIFANGGEEGFVGQMVEESERFQTRCKYVGFYSYSFHPPKIKRFYKMVYINARENVICDHYRRKPP